jgi:hypothetical protein
MATATALALQVALRVRDPEQEELTAAQYLSFVNMALDDLSAAGWLLPQAENETLTFATGTNEYAVPSGIAYIRRLMQPGSDGSYDALGIIPSHFWWINHDAQIEFLADFASQMTDGKAIRITGQKRPSTGVVGSDTIQPGMEGFVRERAVAYAAEFLAAGDSNLAAFRQRMADSNWPKSEKMLANHPMEFRVKPSSIHVPGR